MPPRRTRSLSMQPERRVSIRKPELADCAECLAAVKASRFLNRPRTSPPSVRAAFRRYLDRISGDAHAGFLVLHRETGTFAGVINSNSIIRFTLQSGFLGYYAFVPHAGQGLMYEGRQLVLAHAFKKLKLHRIEANIQPGNEASRRLAQRCGFVLEGFSRRYLKLRGRWRDHERWALLVEDWRVH